MNRIIFHIDFNSYFATVEQQANPRLRGKPIGVTGGDRTARTVLGAASVEAKRLGVKTGMSMWEAKRICPQLIIVPGDSDKYLATTKIFLNILKDYSPFLEVFSIDEAFLELPITSPHDRSALMAMAVEIKDRIRQEVGDYITCSIGISYNKTIAKLAGSLYKPDGLVMIENPEAAMFILDRLPLEEVCGIGSRTKKRLNDMGIFDFKALRQAPLGCLLASFKSYGQFLYNIARGEDDHAVVPFYDKEEIKSVGHRHTIDHDTDDEEEIREILMKLTELVGRRLRAKHLVGKTVHLWFRYRDFSGDGCQDTIEFTCDGFKIFEATWRIFQELWDGRSIRMIGAAVSNLKPLRPENLSLLTDKAHEELIFETMDKINDKYGEFVLQRASVLNSANVYRKPNPFLSDRRFKI